MRTRSNNPFSTVTTSGLLLPIDLLVRIADGDPDLKGLQGKDYHLRSGERLNEAAARAWSQCLSAWKAFRKRFDALPASDKGTTTTRDEWLLPLFQELGYGRLQTKKALDFDGTEYPITHGWEDHVPIHLLSACLPLDRRTPGVSGAAARAPYSLMQELLNRSAAHRWGFVSNGLKLFVLRDNAALARAANVEFDLEAMMDGEVYADFFLLFCLCHQSRVEIRGTDSQPTDHQTQSTNPEDCWLEDWANQADQQGTRAREKLRDGVEASIQSLGAGFLTTRGNEALRARLRSGELSTQDYYRQLLRLVYRILMLLVAEEKRDESGDNLLHPPGTSPEVRDRYARYYGVGRVRSLAYERRGTAHTDLYESLKVLFLKLRTGYEPLGIPGMGSFLFSDDSTPDLDDALLANLDLLDAFRNLCYTEDTSGRGGSYRRPVDFGNLGSEELGSVYESLLELHPLIDTDEGPFTLGTAAGHERKTTGSYYTPTSLINCLLDSALDPVVHEAINVPDTAEAERKLLDLKVCDPACGSGHFLIAAADRMAMHLARIRTGDDQPNTIDIQHAKRDIIGRCIYGVDMNPMAVELCKVSLWMEALEPGKPLSFLDHHIQCGNSLIGATPKLLAGGIPDDAFRPIEGDDKEVCKELKKRNAKERREHRSRQKYLGEAFFNLGDLAVEIAQLEMSPDDTLEARKLKEQRYFNLQKGSSYKFSRLWADSWCSAFFWKKDNSDLAQFIPSERRFRRIRSHPTDTNLQVVDEVQRLSNKYGFFHWHIAFPDVFMPTVGDDDIGDGEGGWRGGFDILVGNPPWEKINLKDAEYFATSYPDIAKAKTKAKRKAMIEKLKVTAPGDYEDYMDEQASHDRLSQYFRFSGRYPKTGVSRVNLYSLFAETAATITDADGRFGMVLASGIVTDDNNKELFSSLVEDRKLICVWDFENREAIFADVHRMYKFCIFCGSGGPHDLPAEFCFFLTNPEQLREDGRIFTLDIQDLTALNPNSRTCPTFRNAREAEITKRIYKRVPAWSRHEQTDEWPGKPKTPFNMANDSDLFVSVNDAPENAKDLMPVYESKFVWQFNHRFATLGKNGRVRDCSDEDLRDQHYQITSQHLMPVDVFQSRYDENFFLVYRMITNATNERTCVASLIPDRPSVHSVSVVLDLSPLSASLLLCDLNSFVHDYCCRQKVGGTNFNHWMWHQLPQVPLCDYESSSNATFDSLWISCRAIELSFSSLDIKSFAHDCKYNGPPFRWDEERRFAIRCELDAAYFHLYLGGEAEWGADNATLREMFPTPRHAVDYIMDTFPIVRRKDEAKYDGEYRTKTTILRIYDEMAEAIRTGVPYQTSLKPPPGPPTDARGNFIPFADWTDEIRELYRDVIHLDSVEPNDKQEAKRKQGEAILYLRLLLKERGKPVQREVFHLDLCFALNRDLRRRILINEPINVAERLAETPTEVLPQLREQLEALKRNGIIELTMVSNRQVVELLDESGLDSALCQSMLPMVREAIGATTIILGKRDDDNFSPDAMNNLHPFVKEGELEDSITL